MMNRSQLVWRCRRGVRELDVLFSEFLESGYTELNKAGQRTFQRLLEIQDPTIMDWLFNKSVPEDSEIKKLIVQLQQRSGLEKTNLTE